MLCNLDRSKPQCGINTPSLFIYFPHNTTSKLNHENTNGNIPLFHNFIYLDFSTIKKSFQGCVVFFWRNYFACHNQPVTSIKYIVKIHLFKYCLRVVRYGSGSQTNMGVTAHSGSIGSLTLHPYHIPWMGGCIMTFSQSPEASVCPWNFSFTCACPATSCLCFN